MQQTIILVCLIFPAEVLTVACFITTIHYIHHIYLFETSLFHATKVTQDIISKHIPLIVANPFMLPLLIMLQPLLKHCRCGILCHQLRDYGYTLEGYNCEILQALIEYHLEYTWRVWSTELGGALDGTKLAKSEIDFEDICKWTTRSSLGAILKIIKAMLFKTAANSVWGYTWRIGCILHLRQLYRKLMWSVWKHWWWEFCNALGGHYNVK